MFRLFERSSEENQQSQAVAVLILLAVVSLIIGGLYLAQSTTNITTVRDIDQLRTERNNLVRENERLKAQIARFRGIDNLMTRAAALGFEEANRDDIQYVIVDGYEFAQPTAVPTQVLPTPTTTNYEENFAGWLERQLDSLQAQFNDWMSN